MKPISLVIPGNPVPMGRPRVGQNGTILPKRTVEAKAICEVTIPGNPIPKGRPRVHNGIARTPERTIQAELRFGWKVKEAMIGVGGPDDSLYAVHVEFFERRKHGQEADVDNCQKLIGDALNGVVWSDDSQVIEWYARIYRNSDVPRTELIIYRIDDSVIQNEV